MYRDTTSGDEAEEGITQRDLSGPIVDRRTTMKLLSVAGMTGLAGCTGGGGSDSTTEASDDSTTEGMGGESSNDSMTETTQSQQSQRRQGGQLTAAWFEESVQTLDPPYSVDYDQFPIIANIFNGLIWLAPDLTVRSDLAKDWEVSNGGKTFTFDLRKDVKFHNGTDFTADDVKYTIRRSITEETPAAPKLAQLKGVDEDGVVVHDDFTVELNFKQPFAPALIYLTRGPGRVATIVNKEAIAEMGADKYATQPIGTGPFEVDSFKSGQSIELKRFDNYFKTDDEGTQLPYLDSLTINLIPEPSTITTAIQSGDVSFLQAVPLQKINQLSSASDVEVVKGPGVAFEGLIMNTVREPFGDPKARRGIAKLIDKENFVKTAFFGQSLPAVGPINKATKWVWREDKPDSQTYDPEKGKQLLKEAGARNASFTITTSQPKLRISKTVRQQLNSAGLNVELDQVTGATFSEQRNNGEFDTMIIGSGGDPDPDQSLYNFFRLPESAGGDGVWNFGKWENQTVHDLLGEQQTQIDRAQRKKTLRDAEDRIMEDAPFAFLHHANDIAAKKPSVKGYEHIPAVRYFESVWVDE